MDFPVSHYLSSRSPGIRGHTDCTVPDLLAPAELYDCHQAITKLTGSVDEQEA